MKSMFLDLVFDSQKHLGQDFDWTILTHKCVLLKIIPL